MKLAGRRLCLSSGVSLGGQRRIQPGDGNERCLRSDQFVLARPVGNHGLDEDLHFAVAPHAEVPSGDLARTAAVRSQLGRT